jgi:hypothetical protein
VATEWQDQMAASMSMRLPIEGTAVDWCALLFASFTFVELQKKNLQLDFSLTYFTLAN